MAELDLNVFVKTHGTDKLKNIGKVALGATAALGGIAAFTSGFASDLNESMSKVGVVFGQNAKDIQAWAKTASKSMGISEQAALESAGTFGNLFTAMDIGVKPAADMSKSLVELASDLASFNNISTDEALVKLRAGIVGEAEPLRTLGVNISAAATELKALELGLIESGEAMTPAIKAQANYALILEQTTTAQGDFARTSDGMANQQRTLAAVFQDTMATVGQAFVPIIEAILPALTSGLQAFGSWVTDNGPVIGSTLQGIGAAIGAAFTFVVNNIIPTLVQGFQFLQAHVLPGLIAAFQSVVAWVVQNMPTISSVATQVFGAVANIVKVVGPIISALAEVVLPALGVAAGVLFKVLDVAFKGIGGAFEALGNVFDTVSGFIEDTIAGVVGFVKGAWNAFAAVWNNIQISVPSVDIPFVGVVGGFSIGLPDLPMLAKGGIVTKPTLALIGESGPEAVIPLRGSETAGNVNNFTFHVQSPIPDEKGLVDVVTRSQRLQGMLAWD